MDARKGNEKCLLSGVLASFGRLNMFQSLTSCAYLVGKYMCSSVSSLNMRDRRANDIRIDKFEILNPHLQIEITININPTLL